MLYLHNLHYEKFSDGTVKRIKDKMPFDIPNSWAWVRLSLIFKVINGDRGKNYPAKSSLTSNGIPFISAVNLDGQTVVNDDKLLCLSESQYDKLGSGKLTQGDVVVCIRGSLGKHGIYPFDKGAIASSLVILRALWAKSILSKYLSIYLDSSLFFNEIKKYDNGSAQPNLAANDLEKFFIPIPPEKEMTSLMSTVEGFFTIILNVSDNQNEIEKLIVKLKSKILDLAIKGKLVPQDPTDESASILLERIRKEKEDLIKAGKLKRDKRESVIFRGEDNSYYEKFSDGTIKCIAGEIPFVLPTGWCWVRLGNVSSIARGGSPRPIDDYLTDSPEGVNWIKIGDTEKDGKYIYKTKEKIKPEGVPKSRFVRNGDFLLTNSMSFGRPYILKTDGCIHDGWLVIGEIDKIFNQDFLYYGLSSQFMFSELSKVAAGSTVQNLKSDTVKNVLFPIPPLKEQKGISKRIIELFSILSAVEVSLS